MVRLMFIIFVQWRKGNTLQADAARVVGLLREGLLNVLVQVQSEQLIILMWRNRYTHRTQNAAPARDCRFESYHED